MRVVDQGDARPVMLMELHHVNHATLVVVAVAWVVLIIVRYVLLIRIKKSTVL